MGVWQEACAEGEDPVRALLEHILQRVLEEEMTAFVGAEPHERTSDRRGYRNGHQPRTLTTRVGRVELLVPRDREGRFRTELFERYQRSEKALVLTLMEMYVQGVSTRKVKQITEALCGLEISRSQVSELAKGLEEQVQAWRMRPIQKGYPYLVVDALYEKVRHGPQVLADAVLVVTGISQDGYRQHLGVWAADTESEATWSEVFGELKGRGLEGVRYVVSDAHEGIRSAVARQFQGAVWSRCQVHMKRNVLGKVRHKDRDWVACLLRQISDGATLDEARAALREALEQLWGKYPEVGRMLEEEGEEMLGVYALPPEHRKQMSSTNMLERWFEEVRRRTRVVRVFPNRSSCLRLIAAHCMEANEEWLGRRYFRMKPERNEDQLAGERDSACERAEGTGASSHAETLEM